MDTLLPEWTLSSCLGERLPYLFGGAAAVVRMVWAVVELELDAWQYDA